MTRLLNLRSIRAAIARGERRLAVLDGKRAELVGSIAELRAMLPQRFPLMSQETFRQKVLGEAPEHHEQPQVELIKVTPLGYETATGYEGDAPGHHEESQVEYVERPAIIMPKPGPTSTTTTVANTGDDSQAPQATDAEQRVDIAHTEPYVTTTVELPDAGLVAKAVKQASGTPGAAKVGWQKGLSRKKTPCPHSPIPHRHRVADPSKPTELTCVGIVYPAKAATS